MTAPIEDVSSLPGKKVTDQEQNPIGEIKDIYTNGDGYPTWVTVETSAGLGNKRTVFIPLARLKDEDGDLRVPYSQSKINDAPEIDAGDGISEECDLQLRGYYGIGTGDQEMWSDNKSYAAVVTETPGKSERAEDADQVETPDADKRTEETQERLHDPGSSEMRKVTADDVVDDDDGNGGGGGGGGGGEEAKDEGGDKDD
jgi:PRC-barrel domain